MLHPTPCESNGALGITASPVYPPAAVPWLRGPSMGGRTGDSTVSTAGNVALGQLQLPLHHKPCCGISQTLPGMEEKGV